MPRFDWRALALLAIPASLANCDVGDDCSPLACSDGVWVVAAPTSNIWEEGEYELEVTHDGATERCHFRLPYDLPHPNATTLLDCGAELKASLFALSDCTNCSLSNELELNFYLGSTPEELSVQLTRGSDVVLSDARRPKYEEIHLRGRECGGGCQQAQLSLELDYDAGSEGAGGSGGAGGADGSD